MLLSNCVACATGFHNECFFPDGITNLCCCSDDPDAIVEISNAPVAETLAAGEVVLERKGKSADQMQDPISTGRKRAAAIKPISKGMRCEWAGLRFAGGGVIPIIGCFGSPATNIHHGPDKDVLNNAEDNLHRICAACHNRWHSLNDSFYGERPTPGTGFTPVGHEMLKHDDKTKAPPKLVFESELWWETKDGERKPFFNSPSPTLEKVEENV